ncbi:MAG: alpha-glucosidase [Lachnospiraceae bacterium]|nr:alpha-glucosidase [Lachnospiraceae bacterium]
MWRIEEREKEKAVTLKAGDTTLLCHTEEDTAFFIGTGREDIRMYRGNFTIEDRAYVRYALHYDGRRAEGDRQILLFSHPEMRGAFLVTLSEENGILRMRTSCEDDRYNRLFVRFTAEKKERVFGGGEQFSCLNLRGKVFPVWTREQGVGRNPLTEVTRLANASDGGGGDYHTTFFPQPTFLSSRLYFAHLENYDYAELDFCEEAYHELRVWNTRISMRFGNGPDYRTLVSDLTTITGRQPALPAHLMKGLWLGVQGGTKRVLEILESCRESGMDISAVWIQDWEGRRVTSFGKRLQWDWRWNEELYPGLDEVIKKDPDVKWMGYINPYLVEGGVLFGEASEKGYFVKNKNGEDYLFDFGEYDCGVVDLTSPEAFAWYKEVIKKNLIGLGFRGWMADFGEYLPADCVCANGKEGLVMHNEWPVLWARCNREAVEEAGLLSECVFFMRAGGALAQRYSTLLWAGDQCVDYSEDDGLPSVITAALSAGLSGMGLHTSDIGGYTTLFHLMRDEELLLRWTEMAVFTPVMRTHEGNRPESNVQIYDTEELRKKAARLIGLHNRLLPYLEDLVKENEETGIPVMRPLFFAAPDDEEAYDKTLYSYLLGDELLVAPVVAAGESTRDVWLPEGTWRHLFSGLVYGKGHHTVGAPLGEPPVFYRTDGAHAALFEEII